MFYAVYRSSTLIQVTNHHHHVKLKVTQPQGTATGYRLGTSK
jgi:hypothetical protein